MRGTYYIAFGGCKTLVWCDPYRIRNRLNSSAVLNGVSYPATDGWLLLVKYAPEELLSRSIASTAVFKVSPIIYEY